MEAERSDGGGQERFGNAGFRGEGVEKRGELVLGLVRGTVGTSEKR